MVMPTASNSGWRVHRRCEKNIEVEEVIYQAFYLKPVFSSKLIFC
jgi:hypothetical protein